MVTSADGGVRLAELIALLSVGTDLGLGQPMEHMVRACLIAMRLVDDIGLDERERAVVYYAGLLAWVGCHIDAYEQAKWLGDDVASKLDAHYAYDFGSARGATAFMLKHIGGAGRPLTERVRVGAGHAESVGQVLAVEHLAQAQLDDLAVRRVQPGERVDYQVA